LILGEQSYRSLDELPEPAELVVITIRPAGFAAAIDDAVRTGARAIVAITAGLGELDDAGRAVQDAAVARCREAGTILVGPNCLGIADLTTSLDLTWDDFGPGPVGLISQSGNVGLELAQHAHDAAVGFTRFVSLGNQADLDAAECVEDFINHEPTRLIAVYIEDFGDGRRFAASADRARRAGKPVILLTVGASAASARTAHSHTGALVSDSLAVDAACAASGIYRVDTPLQMIDLAQLLLADPPGLNFPPPLAGQMNLPPPPAGEGRGGGLNLNLPPPLAGEGRDGGPNSAGGQLNLPPPLAGEGWGGGPNLAGGGLRVGIVGDGGGHVALAADRLIAHGLRVEPLSPDLAAKLAAALPPTASTSNPVDIAGGGEEDVWNFERAVRGLADSGQVDAVLLTGYFGGYSEQVETYAEVELEVAQALATETNAARCRLIVQTMYPRSPTAMALRKRGVPVFGDIEAAALALGRLSSKPSNPPGLEQILPPPLAGQRKGGDPNIPTDYFGVRDLLRDAGIPFAEATSASSEKEAVAAATRFGYPVVLKALGPVHKSDAGGVRLAIANEAALIAAVRDMQRRLHPSHFSVEREAPIELGIELLIGVKRDRSFGPIALVGLGGLHAEVFRDARVALAPLGVDQAIGLIKSLRGAQLLTGWRNRSPLDVEAAAQAISALSQIAAALPQVAEIEINPLLVLDRGVLALDARLALATDQSTAAP
jgi:acyl-CoA synthetase (NDP forming)